MTENELHKEAEMRMKLTRKIMDAAEGMPVNVVFDVVAYVVAQCIHSAPEISPTKVLQDFNDRVVDMHRVIAESDDEGGGEHTLQ